MSFCGNCGTTIPEGSPFCPTCGAPAPAPAPAQGGNKFDLKKIIIAGVAVVLVVVLCIVLFSSCGGGGGASSPEKVVDKFLTAAYKDFDAEATFKCMMPEDIIDEQMEKEDMEPDEAYEEFQDKLDDLKEAFEDNDVKISWEIGDVDELDKDDIKDIQEIYEDQMDLDIEIEDAATVEVELIAEADGDENSMDMDWSVVKIDGDWYVDVGSMAKLFMGMAG